jgi:hypothetical protein
MTALRAILVRACLGMYPRAWRDRYAEEVMQLVEDAGCGIGDLAELAVGGLGRRVDELHGGALVESPFRSVSVILAAVVAMPTAIFIGLNLVNPNVRLLPQNYDNVLIPVLPALALVIALAPVVRVEMRRDEAGGLTVTTRVLPMSRALIAVVAVCLVLLSVVVAYGVSENLLEAMR